MVINIAKHFFSMKPLIIALLLLMLLGCTSQPKEQQMQNITPATEQEGQKPIPVQNTSNETETEQKQDNISNQTEISYSDKVQVHYFYSPACHFCTKLGPFLEEQQQKFNNTTEWHKHNVMQEQGYDFFNKTISEKNLSSAVPIILVNNKTLEGFYQINSSLEKLLQNSTG